MIELQEKLVFVNVNTDYLRVLNDKDPEVQYSPRGYDEKPFLGILIANGTYKYVVPLSSAKEKHTHWKDRYSDGRFLITDVISREAVTSDTVYKEYDDVNVKRIYAVTDVKKMIPIKDGLYCVVDLGHSDSETKEERDYKILQNKEYGACVKLLGAIIEKADAIYSKQKASGKVQRFACNFTLLEEICDKYSV